MEFNITIKRKKVEVLTGVLDEIGKTASGAEWGVKVKQEPLTMAEVSALKRSLGVQSVNVQRATRVKSLMLIGKNPVQIHIALREYGRGYGLSSIKHDHAVLSRFIGK